MTTKTLPQKLMASSLCLFLVSCSATRPVLATQRPTGPHDLARYVLIVQELPDGQVTHDWKPLKDFELTKFQYLLSTMSANRGIVRVSSTGLEEYCEGRRAQCEQDCLASSRPIKVGHWIYQDVKIRPWREAKWRWCPENCMEQAVQCNKGRGSWAEEYVAEFNAIEPAVDWLKTHREEILVGTVIVIAGVAFVAAVAASGGGALILVPLVFVAENPPGLPAAPPHRRGDPVRIYQFLHSAFLFAASRMRAAGLEGRKEEQRLWIQVNAYRDFIMATGQVYLFEDYLAGVAPTSRPHVSTALGARQDTTSQRVMALLLKALDETPEPEQKQSVSLLIHQVNFIADTGQLEACEDYINNRLDHAPLAIAHFTTREEAEAWLKGLAEPPSPALILIGDEYHQMVYAREDNARFMYREYRIEPYVEGLVAEGIPPKPPSFKNRAEAEAWLESHPAAPFEFVSIAGELHLAVHHKRLKRHTLHHVASTLTEWEEEKKRAAEREQAQEEATTAGEDE